MKLPVLILAIIGCLFITIMAHEITHLFQEEFTDVCFSLKHPIAYVWHRNILYYSDSDINEFWPSITGTVVWTVSLLYVSHTYIKEQIKKGDIDAKDGKGGAK